MTREEEKTKKMLTEHIVRCRSQQNAKDFIQLNRESFRLYGKSVEELVACSDKKRVHEVILLEDESAADRFEGDAVVLKDVFASSENVFWDGNNIAFKTDGGILLSANQFAYIEEKGPLPQYRYFAKSNNKDEPLLKIWKTLYRKAGEARRDKAKDTLYLCIGTVKWQEEGNSLAQAVETYVSPLLLCQITEVNNSKDFPRFTISADNVKTNSLLERRLKENKKNIYEGIGSEELPFGKRVLHVLEKIEKNAEAYPDVEISVNDLNICNLDSTYETICQHIENNIDELSKSPMLQVLAGAIKYEELPIAKIPSYPVYPLPTDDSQRAVIQSVLDGNSVNISAAAGTGKSHLMVLLAACLLVAGKNLCVMSEKQAANEVFLKYAEGIGIAKYCLEINNKMTVSQIVDQLERISITARVYLDAIKARNLLIEIDDIEKWFENYNSAVYDEIKGVEMTLYKLIGEAIERDEVKDNGMLDVEAKRYRNVCVKLNELQQTIDNVFTPEEFADYIEMGTSGEEESDELLTNSIDELDRLGVDIESFVKNNGIPASDVAAVAQANIARKLACAVIKERNLANCGNITLRANYAKLTEAYAKLQSLYIGYICQQISERIVNAVSEERETIALLQRIKTSRITVKDFFKNYGKSVMKLCPVIVTTPSAAVTYMTEEMNTFDALLIDEASQVPIISVLPFLKGNRQLVAFGDNNQLDITKFFTSGIGDGYDENGEFDLSSTDQSILHIVEGKIPSDRLRYHYRSKTQHLVTVSNALCYSGMLNITPDVYTGWDKLPENLGYELIKIDVPFDTAQAVAAIPKQAGKTKKGKNTYLESYVQRVKSSMIESVAEKVINLMTNSPDKSIGIVTLNEKLKNEICDKLEECDSAGRLVYNPDDDNAIWVRSLENAQGKEADIVIIAIESANRNPQGVFAKNISGFFNSGANSEMSGNKRLNVLFTRAREKNIIFVAFDKDEIKNSEGSLKRLYTYLEYAESGNMSCVGERTMTIDSTNDYAAAIVKRALPEKSVRKKVGSNNLMVDLGLLGSDAAEKYEAGFILPDKRYTPNAFCTKLNLLERAGWKIIPMSLVFLLSKPEKLASQLPKMLANGGKIGNVSKENYLTVVKPDLPVTLEEIATRGRMDELCDDEEVEENADAVKRLTLEEFALLDAENVCRSMCIENIRNASQSEIDARFRDNSQAFLVKLAQLASCAAASNNAERVRNIASKVQYLYKTWEEKRACYLYVQLLRTLPDFDVEVNQEYLKQLLEDAKAYIK